MLTVAVCCMAGTDYMQIFMKITHNVVPHLEKLPGVSNVTVDERGPTERHQLLMWEQQNSCLLPDDVKAFFMTTNGLSLKWCVKFDDNVLPIGLMEVNSLDKLVKVCGAQQSGKELSLSDIDYDTDDDDDTKDFGEAQTRYSRKKPHFDSRSRIFELDPCKGCGKVCIVYHNAQPGTPAQKCEIWFLDLGLRWHFLADSFTEYFQMMLVHIGLPEWQYAFTDIGLSPEAQTWFHMFAPMRLAINEGNNSVVKSFLQKEEQIPEIALDTNKAFKAKSEKRAKSGSQKKKQTTMNKPSSGSSRFASSPSHRGNPL